jgi:hypothetical protein
MNNVYPARPSSLVERSASRIVAKKGLDQFRSSYVGVWSGATPPPTHTSEAIGPSRQWRRPGLHIEPGES